ncbi:MAG: FeoB small GTPase domain-containing protein, partial [Bacillota bacterium]|nr:FeoB small GTPase domain-containing protein [Bacillota bacterium]
MTLRDLEVGKSGTVVAVGGSGALRQHFLDMGLIPGVEVTLVKYAPMGDPMELMIHGYELTLRLADAEQISIENIRDGQEADHDNKGYNISGLFDRCDNCSKCREHPGLGEGGRYHKEEDGNPLPEGELITFALAGNQNCGKTTLFNALTGSNQRVGNFPGVTVDRKDGAIKGQKNTSITDLPGIYSMSPYTSEEKVSRQFILDEKPKALINIVDATNIERNLYLTMQLMEMDMPMVVALNMMDEVTGNGGTININELEALLGIPIVPISAINGKGINELVDHAMHVAKYQEKPSIQDFCGSEDHGGAVHRCLHGIMHLIEDHAKAKEIPLRFAAAKLVEGDQLILEALELTTNEIEAIEHLILQMEEERGLDRSAAIAEMRFGYITKICRATV